MVDIHSATAEIRRGEEEEEEEEEETTGKNIVSASATQDGHKDYGCFYELHGICRLCCSLLATLQGMLN